MTYGDRCEQWWREEPCPNVALVGVNAENGVDTAWVCFPDFEEHLQRFGLARLAAGIVLPHGQDDA